MLEVEDRGVGIKRTEIVRVFEPFYRVGDEQTRNTRGLGLGLYLVRSITELMGGSVQVEPLLKGTRFSLRFPLARPAQASGNKDLARTDGVSPTRRKGGRV